MKRFVFLYLFVTSIGVQLYCQNIYEPRFYNIDAGVFGCERVFHQHWDSKGGLWMGTDKGFAYYNGYSTKRWVNDKKNKNSIISDNIQCFFVDKSDLIWIAYVDKGGITRYNPKTDKFTHYLPDSTNKKAFPEVPIVKFKEDEKGRFWILTWGRGLIQWNRENGTFKHYDFLGEAKSNKQIPCSQIKEMIPFKNGLYLLGFFSGGAGNVSSPSLFDPEKGTFTPFPLEDYKAETTEEQKRIEASSRIVHFLQMDKNGNLWMGTYSGLSFFDLKNKTAKRISGKKFDESIGNLENTRAGIIDNNGYIWVATTNSGILRVNINNFKATYVKQKGNCDDCIADNALSTMATDPEGNIWISVGLGGFSVYTNLKQQFLLKPWNELNLDFSNASAQMVPINDFHIGADNYVYLSSETGITLYDYEKDSIVEVIKPKGKSQASEGNFGVSRVGKFRFYKDEIWMISPDRFLGYSLKTRKFIKPKREYLWASIHFTDQHEAPLTITYGAWNDLRIINPATHAVDSFPGSKAPIINDLQFSHVLKSGNWFFNTNQWSFTIFDPVNKTFKYFSKDSLINNFPDSTITNYYCDKKGVMWIATQNGLYTYDENTDKITSMNGVIGIEAQEVYNMTQDRFGNYWVAFRKKLLRWNSKTGEKLWLNKSLGLNGGNFLLYSIKENKEGKLFFATTKGLMIIDPSQLTVPNVKANLSVTKILLNSTECKLELFQKIIKGNYTFDWDDNFLTFEVGTSQIFTPTPSKFFYKLKGLDSVWVDNGTSNTIRFTNLSYGSYILQVYTINSYQVKSHILELPFIVAKPFWKKWWFIGLLIIVGLLIVFAYIKIRERVHVKQKQLLEQKVQERTMEVVEKANEIKLQKEMIEEKNKELTDSIHYAQRIQQSILPDKNTITKHLPQHFIYFRPKDIVSGDFYWFSKQKDSILWAIVDCTGHGVPGGFMSMLGSGLLNQIVNEELKLEPNIVLDHLRERVIIALKQTGEIGDSRDGMDVSFCRYIISTGTLQFAGANNSAYIIRDGALTELLPDKQPVGVYSGDTKNFTLREIEVQKGDQIYMTSDGYCDQFGGDKGKKFKTSNFEKLIQNISSLPIANQIETLSHTFETWKSDYEQLDDVCVIGVRI